VAAFLAIYLTVVIAFGVPAMLAELALGRATRRGPVQALEHSGLPGGRAVGILLFVGVGMAMTYYLVVLGWLLAFFFVSIGSVVGASELTAETFAALHSRWPLQMFCSALIAAAGALVVSRGVRAGIERTSRLFLPLFGALTVFLAVWSLTLPGAGEALNYMFTVDLAALTPRAVMAAVGQAFFSLGLGGTFLVIYGSYLPAGAPLSRRAFTTAAGDVGASLLGVLVIMPVAFSYGLSPASGPSLLFEVLPVAFRQMPGGAVFGALFFLGLTSIAFLSGVAAIEVLVGTLADLRGWPRRRTAWLVSAALVVMGLPAMLSLDYIVWSDLVWGSTMQPIGSVAAMSALAWGLGKRVARQQLEYEGTVPFWVDYWIFAIRYVVPGAVIIALLSGWFG